MKNFIALFFLMIIGFSSNSQSTRNDIASAQIDNFAIMENGNKVNSTPVNLTQQLSFVGGSSAMKKLIQKNIKYPNVNFEGKVEVDLVIDKDGKLLNSIIVTKTNPLIAKEVLRLASLLNNWNPTINNGVAKNSKFRLGVVFRDRF